MSCDYSSGRDSVEISPKSDFCTTNQDFTERKDDLS